jgi:hypothetical protein
MGSSNQQNEIGSPRQRAGRIEEGRRRGEQRLHRRGTRCNHWALGDDSRDAPVVRDQKVVEHETLSGFAIQIVLFEASMGSLGWDMGGPMDSRGRPSLLRGVEEVPLRPWTWPNHARFFVGSGMVVHADQAAGDEVWVFASPTSEDRLPDFARSNGIEIR